MRVDGIRSADEAPGLRDFEASFLRLVDKLSNGCSFEINETGTSLRYSPGAIVGGRLEHDCGVSRSVGWFIEGVLPLLPFAKQATALALSGITNDDADPGVDYLRIVTLPLLSRFGIGEGLSLVTKRRGAPPLGGGLVLFSCPVVRELRPLNLTDEGFVRRIRGVAYCARTSPAMANRLSEGAKGVLLPLLPDVFVFTDAFKGTEAGASPGYGVTLVATSTSGCMYGAQRSTGLASGIADAPALAHAGARRATDGNSSSADASASARWTSASGPEPPEDLGASAAALLLDDIARGGCIDTRSQPLVFTLMALGPQDVSRVRIGALGAPGVTTLRALKEVFGVSFLLKPEASDPAELADRAKKEQLAAESDALARIKQSKAVAAEAAAAAGSDDDGVPDGGDPSTRRPKRKDAIAPDDPPPTSAVVAGVGSSRSARSVLVSCLGMGFKNLAKRVT